MNSLTLPDLRIWNAGDKPTKDSFNKLADAFEFAAAPPELWIARVASLTTAPNNVMVPFDKVLLDNCAALGAPMWTSAQPTRLYCQLSGWYETMISTSWNSSADFFRRIQALDKNANGALTLSFARYETVSSGGTPIMVSEYPLFLTAGEYIELEIYADTASSQIVTQVTETPDYRFAASVHMKWVSN